MSEYLDRVLRRAEGLAGGAVLQEGLAAPQDLTIKRRDLTIPDRLASQQIPPAATEEGGVRAPLRAQREPAAPQGESYLDRIQKKANAINAQKRTAGDAWRSFLDRPSKAVPFLGGVTGAYEDGTLLLAANRMRAGKATAEDEALLYAFMEEAQAPKTAGHTMVSILTEMPAYIGEFMASAGFATAGRKLGRRAAQKALGKMIGEAIEGSTKRKARRMAVKVAGEAGAAAGISAYIPTRMAANIVRESIPEMQLDESDPERAAIVFAQQDESFMDHVGSVYRGAMGTWIENLSELSGAALGKIPPAPALRKLQTKLVEKFALSEKIPFGEAVNRLVKAGGWNGFAEEWGEERFGGALNALLLGEDWSGVLPESPEAALGEAGALLLGGVGLRAGAAGAVKLQQGAEDRKIGESVKKTEEAYKATQTPLTEDDGEALVERAPRKPADAQELSALEAFSTANQAAAEVINQDAKEGERLEIGNLEYVEATSDADVAFAGEYEEMGLRAVYVKGDAPLPRPAMIAGDAVLIDAMQPSNVRRAQLGLHEALHRVKTLSGETWEQTFETIRKLDPEGMLASQGAYADRIGKDEWEELSAEMQQEEGMSLYAEQLVGYMEYRTANPEGWAEALQSSPGLATRLIDALIHALNKLPGVNLQDSRRKKLFQLREDVAKTAREKTMDPETATQAVEALQIAYNALRADTQAKKEQGGAGQVAAEQGAAEADLEADGIEGAGLESPRARAVPKGGREASSATETPQVAAPVSPQTPAQRRRAEKKARSQQAKEEKAKRKERQRLDAFTPKPAPRKEDRARRKPVETRAERAIRLSEEGEEDAGRFAAAPRDDIALEFLERGLPVPETGPRVEPSAEEIAETEERNRADLSTLPLTRWEEFRKVFQDKYVPLAKLVGAAKAADILTDPNADPELLERLRKGRTFVELNKMEKRYVEPLIRLAKKHRVAADDVKKLAQVAGLPEDAFDHLTALDVFLIQRHAPERNKTIREIPNSTNNSGSGLTDAQAAKLAAWFAKMPNAAGYTQMGRVFDRMNNERLRLMEKSGLELPAIIKAMRNYKHYAPLRGDVTEEEDAAAMSVGRGIDIRGKEGRRATGRGKGSIAESPMAYAFAQYATTIVRAEKQVPAQALLKLIQEINDPALAEVDVPEVETRVVNGILRRQYDPTYQLKDEVFSVKVGGVEHHITFKKPYDGIARAVKGLDARHGTAVTQMVGKATRVLAGMSTRYNPVFPPFNFIRDAGMAFINASDRGYGFALRTVRNIPAAQAAVMRASRGFRPESTVIERDGATTVRIKKGTEADVYYQEFVNAGGLISTYDYTDVKDIEKRVRREVNSIKPGQFDKVGELGRDVLSFFGNVSDAIENGTRLAYYIELRREGVDIKTAALAAKDLTTNFETKGDIGGALNAWYMFANAGIQGTARMGRALKNKRVQALVGGGMVGIALMEALNRAIGGEDEDGVPHWDKVPQYIKDRNLVLMSPSGSGSYISVPVPLGYNFFHSFANNAGAMLSGNKGIGETTGDIAMSAVDAFNPLGGAAQPLEVIAPTVLDPLVQSATNKDWAGRPIMPSQVPWGVQKPDSEMHWPNVNPTTNAVAKFLNRATGGDEVEGGLIDVSPETLSHYASFVTGGLGTFTGRVLDLGDKAVRGEEIDLATDVPLVRRVLGKPSPYEPARQFREHRDEIELAHKRITLLRDKTPEERLAVRKEYGALAALRKPMMSAKRRLSGMQDRLELAEARGDTETAKRIAERIRDTYVRFNALANSTRDQG